MKETKVWASHISNISLGDLFTLLSTYVWHQRPYTWWRQERCVQNRTKGKGKRKIRPVFEEKGKCWILLLIYTSLLLAAAVGWGWAGRCRSAGQRSAAGWCSCDSACCWSDCFWSGWSPDSCSCRQPAQTPGWESQPAAWTHCDGIDWFQKSKPITGERKWTITDIYYTFLGKKNKYIERFT